MLGYVRVSLGKGYALVGEILYSFRYMKKIIFIFFYQFFTLSNLFNLWEILRSNDKDVSMDVTDGSDREEPTRGESGSTSLEESMMAIEELLSNLIQVAKTLITKGKHLLIRC